MMRSFRHSSQKLFADSPEFTWLTILSGDQRNDYNYLQLEKRILDYCAYYREKELKKGDSVLIILTESIDLFASFHAAIYLGLIPAYYAYPSPKQSVENFVISMQNLLNYNEISLVVTFEEVESVLKNNSEQFKHQLQTISFDKIAYSDNYQNVLFEEETNESFLQFSSGTTAAKKGVLIEIEALFNQIDAYTPLLKFDSKSKIISWLPHYHDMGLIACMFLPFIQKIPIVMMSPFEWVKNPGILLQHIENHNGTHIWLPNFALGHLCKSHTEEELRSYRLNSLKRIILCSEPVLYDTLTEFKEKMAIQSDTQIQIDNCYAMAENTYAMTQTDESGIKFLELDEIAFQKEHKFIPKKDGRKIASAGYPLSNIEIKIVNSEGQELPEDYIGEVLIKSNCMLKGYYRNPEATEKAFLNDYFNTGDMGFFHGRQLYITGRKKDLIIVGGENIYPQDIEVILNREDKLVPGRNVVFGVEDDRLGTEKIVILAELKTAGETPDVNALRAAILNSLNISVREIHFLPHMTLKKGTAGKVSRFMNKNAFVSGEFNAQLRREQGKNENDELKNLVLKSLPFNSTNDISETSSLLKSGLIDSFGFAYLIQSIEESFDVKFSHELLRDENFENILLIKNTIDKAKGNHFQNFDTTEIDQKRLESLTRLKNQTKSQAIKSGFIEYMINHFPIKGSLWYTFLLRLLGVKVGKGVKFLGKFAIKIRGNASFIEIGDDVILGDKVDLRNRENGRIILHAKVYLDSGVRLVAARDGKIEIGYGSEVGGNSIINSGGNTTIGEYVLIAGNCNINSSSHGTSRETYIKEQPHVHGNIQIANDVWIGAGASVIMNTKIGEGSIISGNSLVSGEVAPFSIMAGVPAKLIKSR